MDAEQHAAAIHLRDHGVDGVDLAIAPQVIYEFIATVTSPRFFRRPLSAAEASRAAEELAKGFWFIAPLPRSSLATTLELIARTGRRGRDIFDLVLAATMRDHGIERIFTFDDGFRDIPGVVAERPQL